LISASREGVDLGGYSGFATSNADVPLAALARAALVGTLALAGARAAAAGAAQERQRRQRPATNEDEDADNEAPLLPRGVVEHAEDADEDESADNNDAPGPRRQQKQQRRRQRWCRRASDAASILFLLLLMAKAVAVAVLAPDGLWWWSSSRSAAPSLFFCGLLPLFVSIAVSMVGAAASGLLAHAAIGKSSKSKSNKTDDSCKPTNGASSARQTLRELFRLSAPDTPVLALAFAAGALAAVCSAAVPLFTGRVIDRASIEPDRRELLRQTLYLVAVGALGGVFTGIRGGLFTLAMTRLNVRLRSRLFKNLLDQDAAFFDATPIGELTSRLAADCESVSNSVALNLNVAFRSVLQAGVVLVFMCAASWRLTVVTFVIVPATLALSHAYSVFYHSLAKRVQTSLAEANTVAEEALGAVATVRAHGAAEATAHGYDTKLAAFAKLENRAALAYVGNAAAVTFLPVVSAAGVLFFGGTLVLAGEMSAGALVSYMLYQSSLASSFSQLGDVFSALASAVGAAAKVVELLRRRPEMPPPGTVAPATPLEGRVELRGVHFAYPSRPSAPVLKGLDVSIEPGGTLALVGPSGGGKSSVLKLVQRLYVPSRGAVLLDGRDIGCFSERFLRRQLAVVSQSPVLFRRSVRDNILYGLVEKGDDDDDDDGQRSSSFRPTEEDVIAAARAANAHDFIMAFPKGYDTCVGGRGSTVSGGQCARIAIARALVRRPRVLLLDEATAALDAESEGTVQAALDGIIASHGCTVLMVAHRLSTVVGATKIAVVGQGVVMEEGPHEELARRPGGAYAALVARQLRGGASFGGGCGGGSSAALMLNGVRA
jgi:ATP-binding cassette subfamily B (MDR/TAP) protein 9